MKKGFFIAVEGIDGSGKSTQAKMLESFFRDRNFKVTSLREPGSTELGFAIRELLINRNGEIYSNQTELLLLAAARAQNVFQNIVPALKEKRIIICDRYIDSTMAYQRYGRGLRNEDVDSAIMLGIRNLSKKGLDYNFIYPDLTLIYDIPVKVAINRINKRGQSVPLFEKEAFLRKVRNGYCRTSEQTSRIINASDTIINVYNKSLDIIRHEMLDCNVLTKEEKMMLNRKEQNAFYNKESI